MGNRQGLRLAPKTMEAAELFKEVQGLVGDRLQEVEAIIAENIQAPFAPLAEMGSYLAASRGKRLRPTLLLLMSKVLGYEGRLDAHFAAIYEFIHTATLIHDDIVDQALLRRGRASLSSRWGPELAVLMGDRVFIMAMHLAVREGWTPVIPLISNTTLRLIEGELVQSHRKWDLTLRRDDNLEIIKNKTAHLFAACAQTPALLMDAPREVTEASQAYGLNLGIAFQMVDDCLDFVSDEATLGKPAGNDLKEGKITLPCLLLLERGTPEDRAFVEAVVASRRFDPATLGEVASRIIESGMLQEAEEIARSYAEAAKEALSPFPASPAKSLLSAIPDFVLRRRF